MTKPTSPEYVKARPEQLPQPGYAPFFLALSLAFAGWGLLTSWIFCVAGIAGSGISLYGWIKAILHEPDENN